MSSKIYIKTVNGRKYKYERISTKRVGKKVITKDKYLGPVKIYKGAMDAMTTSQKAAIGAKWKGGSQFRWIIAAIERNTGRTYKDATMRKWCRAEFGKRPVKGLKQKSMF